MSLPLYSRAQSVAAVGAARTAGAGGGAIATIPAVMAMESVNNQSSKEAALVSETAASAGACVIIPIITLKSTAKALSRP